jgi:hypothetical protein
MSVTLRDKRPSYSTARNWIDRIRQDSVGLLNHLVTMDETWIHIYDPVAKEEFKAWRRSGFPRPKKFKSQKSSSNTQASVF